MLKITNLKDSPYYKNQNFIKTYVGYGAFGESEVEGYWEKGLFFNNEMYSDYKYVVIELDNKVIGVTEFKNLSEELQKVVDIKKYNEILKEKEREYQQYLKLKEKFENES